MLHHQRLECLGLTSEQIDCVCEFDSFVDVAFMFFFCRYVCGGSALEKCQCPLKTVLPLAAQPPVQSLSGCKTPAVP